MSNRGCTERRLTSSPTKGSYRETQILRLENAARVERANQYGSRASLGVPAASSKRKAP